MSRRFEPASLSPSPHQGSLFLWVLSYSVAGLSIKMWSASVRAFYLQEEVLFGRLFMISRCRSAVQKSLPSRIAAKPQKPTTLLTDSARIA